MDIVDKSCSVSESLAVHTIVSQGSIIKKKNHLIFNANTKTLHLFLLFYTDYTWYKSLSVMGNSKSKYCIHVQIQEDVPYSFGKSWGPKISLASEKKMSILFPYIYFFHYTHPEE